MAFDFVCPFCHSKTRIHDQYAGQTGPCADCGNTVTIPLKPGTGKAPLPIDQISSVNQTGEMLFDERGQSTAAEKKHHPTRRSRSNLVQALFLLLTVLLLGLGGWLVLMPTAQNAFKIRQRGVTMNNIRQIAAALNAYRRLHGTYPTPTVVDSAGKPLYSWRVLILPQLGYQTLYNRFQLDQAFDSPTNISLLTEMPPVFASPDNISGGSLNESNYALVTGPSTLFPFNAPSVDPVTMSDSPSDTILVVETRDSGMPWTQAIDIDATSGVSLGTKPMVDIGGNSPDYAVVATVNETAYALPPSLPQSTLDAMITPNGNDYVDKRVIKLND